jgi:hypothetical protein
MKIKMKQLLSIVAMFSVAILMSCEGPAGADGIDGTNGADGAAGADGATGTATCLECHAENAILDINSQFYQSQHKLGEFVDYAGNRGSCARCHSSEGFIEFAELGSVEGSSLSDAGAWECKTCHGIHSSFEAEDYALRMKDAFTWIYDATATADFGDNSNLCANCHQSRRAEPNIASPGTTFDITSTHYGPHHGAQANVVYGAGFAEIAGSMSYPTAGESTHSSAGASCVTCHMGTYADGKGGHSWNPTMTSCNTCHSTALTEDFDYKGFQTEIAGLLHDLEVLLLAQGVLEVEHNDTSFVWNPELNQHDTVVVIGTAVHPVVGTHTMAQAQAFFNWVGLEEDRSLGAHNPDYVKALLVNSIEAID